MTVSPRLWAAIGVGAVIVALIIALLSTRATLADVKRDKATVEAKLAVSNASITKLEDEIARMMIEQRALESGDAERIKASREAMQLADAASKVRQAAIDRLNASAVILRPTPDSECQFSDAVLANWP